MEMAMKQALKEKFEYYMNHQVNSEEHTHLLICAYLDPAAHQLMTDEDKQSAKRLLGLELRKMGQFDTNANAFASSLSTFDSSMQVVTLPVATTNSIIERLKLFRRKCGIIDDPIDIVAHKDLTLRQEYANFEAYKKDDISFTNFWQKYASSLPKLNKMALRYGTIPGTSVPSESLFSIAGYVARKTRSSLSAKNLKYSIFLKDKL